MQKVDKEEKKLNEDYAKKVDENIVKDHAKKMQDERKKELEDQTDSATGVVTPGLKSQLRQHGIDINRHKANVQTAENDLQAEINAGRALSNAQLAAAKREAATIQAEIADGNNSNAGRLAELNSKITNTETRKEEIAEHIKSKENSEKAQIKVASRMEDIRNEVAASTEEEKNKLREMRETRASTLENNAFGIKGLGIKALSPKHSFSFLPKWMPDWVKDAGKNTIPQRDVDAAIKEIRNAMKGKGSKSTEAQLRDALAAAAAAQTPPPTI